MDVELGVTSESFNTPQSVTGKPLHSHLNKQILDVHTSELVPVLLILKVYTVFLCLFCIFTNESHHEGKVQAQLVNHKTVI